MTSLLAEKPRKASLAFRNQVQIPPQGLWGPPQCRPTSCHAIAHFWGYCPLPLQKLLFASITNAPSPPSLPLSHPQQVGSRHPPPTLAILSGLRSQTVEARPVCPTATAAAPSSAWQAVGVQRMSVVLGRRLPGPRPSEGATCKLPLLQFSVAPRGCRVSVFLVLPTSSLSLYCSPQMIRTGLSDPKESYLRQLGARPVSRH